MEMQQTLTDFLIGNELDNIEKEVVLNGRLKNFKFKIKAITQSQFSEMQKQCVVLDTKGKKVRFDSTRFSIMTIVKGCIYPNFRVDEFVKACGVTLPEQCVVKKLLPGEISELAKQIMQLSGFDEDINEQVEEVKNS